MPERGKGGTYRIALVTGHWTCPLPPEVQPGEERPSTYQPYGVPYTVGTLIRSLLLKASKCPVRMEGGRKHFGGQR